MTDHDGPVPAADPAGRDRAWFEDLFTAHAGAVHRYFLRRAPRDDVEDLTADVLATAWRRRADLPEGHELPWLYRTAGFVLANHRRKGRPVPVESLPDDADGEYAADPADLVLADAQVSDALAALSDRDRHVLMLHAWEGLDGEELAAALGIGRGGAAAALSRARARLRSAWDERVTA
ncbi:sigma-70 family RNA polymerase sigma factor [Occultella glacieicola]|uniref:Sigma-70 family RNA polymerase sigma factor n=1 Tax=Occultella glacieicola TaxID=2518684 RepID=A0ABY2E3T1_9MICO|nr:sigma-70 family RNA polymerase sigma factor [Occultella glacieicola]TDE94265.1 sigma-70 family RNA polymerase sigma factor [Occultella glacieicola]